MLFRSNGRTTFINTNDTGAFINLGYFEQATQVAITLTFPENRYVNFDTTEFWTMLDSTYTATIHKLKSNQVTAKAIKNGKFNLDKAEIVSILDYIREEQINLAVDSDLYEYYQKNGATKRQNGAEGGKGTVSYDKLFYSYENVYHKV